MENKMGCCGKKRATIKRDTRIIGDRSSRKAQKLRKPRAPIHRSIKLKPITSKDRPQRIKCPSCGHPMERIMRVNHRVMYKCVNCDYVKKI